MSIKDTLRSALAKVAGYLRNPRPQSTNPRHKPQGELVWSSMLGGGVAYGWPSGWSQDRIEQVCHYKHWVWRAIRSRTDYISQLEPNIGFVNKSRKQAKTFKGDWQYKKSLKAIKPHEEVDYVDDDHALKQLLDFPNAWDCAADLWTELNMFWDLTGTAYLWAVPNAMGIPCELWVIPSHWVWPKVERGYGTRYYEIRPFAAGGQPLIIPPEEIIYFHDKSPIHKIDGWAPLTAIAEWEDVDESIQTARYWAMQNGTFPWGAIELDGKYHDPDDAALDRIGAKFYQRYGGTQKAGQPMLLPPGATYKPLIITPDQMLFEAGADQMRDWILAAYSVPKEIAGIQDAGSEIAMYGPLRQFVMMAINPRVSYMGQVLTRWLGAKFQDRPRIWWPDTSPESPEDVRSNLTLAAANGWITPNEGRVLLLDMEPYENGGDDPLVNASMMPMPLNTGDDLSSFSELMPPTPDQIAQDETDVETSKQDDAAKVESSNGDGHANGEANGDMPDPFDFAKRFEWKEIPAILQEVESVTDKQFNAFLEATATNAKAIQDLAAAVLNQKQPNIVVNVPKQESPTIHVDAPVVRIPDFPPINFPEQKDVIINIPKQEAPVVNITSPDIKIPDINIPATVVNVPAANIKVEAAKPVKRKTKVSRNEDGTIKMLEEV